MARVDYDLMAPAYEAARGLPPAAYDVWRKAAARFLTGVSRIVDLGCGTGRFAQMLASAFDTEVIGVEPSAGMLREASRGRVRPGVSYVQGRAEVIPLRAGSCGGAWLSTVIHHFDDLPAAARELRRALRPGSPVLVRSWFPGRGGVFHFRYFPSARRIADTFPTIDATTDAFEAAGFRTIALEPVEQPTAPSLRAAAERIRLRADTTLELVPDEEFEEGMRALERDAAEEAEPRPITSRLDLLVFR